MALLDIGSRKQLFFDDYLIETTMNTKPVLNRARKVDNNPVLRSDRPWEGNHVTLSRVEFDLKDGIFKMWYSTQTYGAHLGDEGEVVVDGEGGHICLAYSKDGRSWDKPDLGLVEFEGSTENNILPEENFRPYFFQDLYEKDPSRRYKGLTRVEERGMQFDLYFSPDGLVWTPYEDNPIIDTYPLPGRWGPTDFMGWDPIAEVYVAHMENCLHRRCPLGKRVIGRAESPDMVNWSEAETIIVPDEEDYPDTEFYAMPTTTYEGIYIGLLWNFRTTNTTHYPEVVFSRDGVHYQRNFREPLIVQGGPGDFDVVSIYANSPIVNSEEILVYYSGVNWRSPQTLLELGTRAKGAIGLATLPLDGFVSLDGNVGIPVGVVSERKGPASFSQVVTRSFSFEGTQLHLNVRSALQQWGAGACEVRVELLSPIHVPIEGFTFEDADPITTTGLDHIASWNGSGGIGNLAGKPVKLRFYFKNAKLYSFQFR
jgi:hypothetical protein